MILYLGSCVYVLIFLQNELEVVRILCIYNFDCCPSVLVTCL